MDKNNEPDNFRLAMDRSDLLPSVGLRVAAVSSQLWNRVPPSLTLVKRPEPSLWWHDNDASVGHYLKSLRWQDVEGLLLKFIKLHNASDDSIMKFAQKWGVLGIWPTSHIVGPPDIQGIPRERVNGSYWYAETTVFWRTLSSHFRAILEIGACLQKNETASYETWTRVLEVDPVFRQPWKNIPQEIFSNRFRDFVKFNEIDLKMPLDQSYSMFLRSGAFTHLEIQNYALMEAVSRWTKNTPIHLSMIQKSGGFIIQPVLNQESGWWDPSVYLKDILKDPDTYLAVYNQGLRCIDITSAQTFAHDSLYPMRPGILRSILVVQMLALLASSLGVCTRCGELYQPPRRQRPDKANLCGEECRKKWDAARKKSRYIPREKRDECQTRRLSARKA